MTFISYVTSPLTRTTRVWGARTADHSYALDVTVDPLTCTEPPRWMLFEFQGLGELTSLDCWAGVIENVKPFGCELVEGTMREVSDDEFTTIALRAQGQHVAALQHEHPGRDESEGDD